MKAMDDILQITDHILLPGGRMDGVIATVAHDEFRGWGFRACVGLWMGGRLTRWQRNRWSCIMERRGEESYNSVQLIYIQK